LFPVFPFALVVLALSLPHIATVALKVIVLEFTFVSLASIQENILAEAFHLSKLVHFSNVFTTILPYYELLDVKSPENVPYSMLFFVDTSILITFSEFDM
jgi:hypothetical protein